MVIVSARATMIAASCFLTHLCTIDGLQPFERGVYVLTHLLDLRHLQWKPEPPIVFVAKRQHDLIVLLCGVGILPCVDTEVLSSSRCHALEAMSYYPLTIRAIPLVSDIDYRLQQTDTAASQVPLEIELTDYTQKLDTATRSQ